MICPKCNAQNEDGKSFCADCGNALPKISNAAPQTVVCPNCKTENNEGKSFCADCGTTLPKPADAYATSLNPVNFCPDCSAPNEQGKSFCADCGTSLKKSPVASAAVPPPIQQTSPAQQFQPQSVETVITPPVIRENVETNSETVPPKKRSKKFVWIGAILLLPLLLFGIALAVIQFIPKQRDKSYLLTDKHETSKALEFADDKGTLLMTGVNENEFQKWQITEDTDYEDSYRFINRGLGTDESFQVIDDKTDDKISMAETAEDDGQLWAITNVEGDFYRITNNWLGDSKALTHNKRKYYFLRLRDTSNKSGQLWKKVPVKGGAFLLTNARYGDKKSLEAIYSGEFTDKIYMGDVGDFGNQQWLIKPTGGGFYTLTTVSHNTDKKNKSLDVNPDKPDRVRMADTGDFTGQRWKMIPVGKDYFRLTNNFLGEGKSLEAVTFSKFEIKMLKASDDPGQLWRIERLSN